MPCLYNLEGVGDLSPETRQVVQFLDELTGDDGVVKADTSELFSGSFSIKNLFTRMLGAGPHSAFIDNSIELIYFDTGSFGHSYLRIGEYKASFNMPQDTTFRSVFKRDFERSAARAGQVGVPIVVPKEKISEVIPEIKKFYESSKEYNVPPMDAYASRIDLKNNNGLWEFESPTSDKYSAKREFIGKVVLDTPEPYILTPNGLTIPIIVKASGDMFVQSYSCSSVVAYVLERYFNIKIDGSSARSVKRQILSHQLGPVIEYTREPQ